MVYFHCANSLSFSEVIANLSFYILSDFTLDCEIWIVELVSICVSFSSSGYDTTASALAYLGYYLAKKPELQDRLQEELDAAFADNGGKMPGYNVIQVHYADDSSCTVCTSLRLQCHPRGLAEV